MRRWFGRWLGSFTLRRIYKNAGKITGGKALAGVLSLAYIAIATRMLGPHLYGVLVLLHLYTVTVISVVAISGWHVVIRYGAVARSENRLDDLRKLIATAALAEIGSGIVALLIVVIGVPFAQEKLGWPPSILPLAMVYCFAGLGGLRSTPTGVLYLFNRFDLVAYHQAVMPIVRIIGASLALAFDGGLTWFVITWLIAGIFEGLVQWALGIYVLWRENLLAGMLAWPRGVIAANKGIWRFVFATKFDVTLSDVSGRITPLTIGWILGPAAAGLYQVAYRASVALAQPGIIVGQAAFPELARLAAEGDHQGVRSTMLRAAFPIGLAGLAVVAVFFLFGDDILIAFAGDKFLAAYTVLVLLGIGRVIQLFALALNPTLLALNRPGAAFAINATSTIALFPALIWLISEFGLNGAGVHAILLAAALASAMALFAFREIERVANKSTLSEPDTQAPPLSNGA